VKRLFRTTLTLFIAFSLTASPAYSGQTIEEDDLKPIKEMPETLGTGEQPWIIRMMIHELKHGMFVAVPIIDTNPNKGTTYGLMPIWVVQSGPNKRIKYIHAPSIKYNPTFKWEATARHYYYPTDEATYFLRGAISGSENKDLIGEMEDRDFLGRGISIGSRVVFDVDGSHRFYGIGPATGENDESTYLRRTLGYTIRIGLPLFPRSPFKFNMEHHLAGEKIQNGTITTLPGIKTSFPSAVPGHFHQNSEFKLFVDYDTRDSANTTSKGVYALIYLENSQRAFGSEFSFQKYGGDVRAFLPWAEGKSTTAMRVRLDQLQGDAPFYLLPSLGGKETHRAYGHGRYRDNGMMTTTLEQRFTAYKTEVAGVTTELELTPFLGLGTVFSAPKRMTRRYMRPVYGVAVRAIVRPQVVGSIDVGTGQEGTKVFMDINYSF
jgi:hypothetical protein